MAENDYICDCEFRETVELDPSMADKYHTCGFCQTIIIDPSQTHHPNTGEKAPEGYCFLQPTLSSIYASKFSCSFAKWLLREWDLNDEYMDKNTSWRDMLPRGPTIRLCVCWTWGSDYVKTESFSRGLISVMWFGLWDPELDWWDRERDPYESNMYPGRCEVGTFHTLDSFVSAGKRPLSEAETLLAANIKGYLDDPIRSLVHTRPINPEPDSRNTFVLVRRWLADCRKNHPDCPTISEYFMPEILVKISAATSQDEEHQVALEFPADSKSLTRAYVALSYCWGGDQIHKTTRSQIAAADFGLDWTALPASIQDAVKVTANLGFEYLWVDSLCIIQDDPVQKARQMAQMCEVYENAALTIRACKAKRAVDGFLHPTNLEDVLDMAVKLSYRMILPPDLDTLDVPTEFSYQDLINYLTWSLDDKSAESEELTGFIYVCCVQKHPLPDDDNVWSRKSIRYQIEPIELRAWTLQERYLSARSLDFCKRQIIWRCPTGSKCHPPTDGWKLLMGGRELETIHVIGGMTPSNPPWEIWDHFYWLVQEYTGRELSVSRDRILAISGIAEKFRSLLRDKYVAGLWRQSLPYTLLWSVKHRPWRQREHRPTEYQGPSWSWTAVNDEVSFQDARVGGSLMQKLFNANPSSPKPWPKEPSTVLRVNATIELEDEGSPVGMVRSGTITGNGRICRAVLFLSEQPRFYIRLYSVEADIPEEKLGESRHNAYRRIRGLRMNPDALEKEMDGIIEECYESESETSYESRSGESEPPEPERGQSESDGGGSESENYGQAARLDRELVKAEGPCVEVFLLEVDVQHIQESELLHGLVLRKVEPTQTLGSKGVISCLDTPDSFKIPTFSRLGTFRIYEPNADNNVDELFSSCVPENFRII